MHTKISNPADFKVALYIRLSKEDEGETESQSVKNQRSLLRTFAKEHLLDIYNEYVDDGFSGTSFERPAFQRMIADIEAGKVNLVLTKDLSRLGRDYILTGHYLERYFPEQNVRYISILDGIDTGVDSVNNDITPFRAIMNDMYAKDISKKIKSVKHDKQSKGLFIGGKAVYGYKLSAAEKNKIVIDEDAAQIVRQVFNYALSGMSCHEIAVMLNDNHVPPPASYANLNITRKGAYSGMWSSERVSDMLKNQTYIGNMVQGKSKKVSYKSEKTIRMKREQWIIVENTHEPLIDSDVFNRVQSFIESRRKTRKRTYDYPLKGVICCHECGYPLSVINRPNAKGDDVLYFVCRTYQRFTKSGVCTAHTIKAQKVIDVVRKKVSEICQEYLNEQELLETGKIVLSEIQKKLDTENKTEQLETKIATITSNMDRLYLDKLSGIVAETDFSRLYTRLKDERTELERRLIQFKKSENKSPKQQEAQVKCLVKQFLEAETIDRELIISLVEKVELTVNKDVIIRFKCRELAGINDLQ